MGNCEQPTTYTRSHAHISLINKRASREKGKRAGERREGGEDCGIEAGGKREEVWSESRGTPDCCYPTYSPSTGAGSLAAAAAAAGEAQTTLVG